MSPKKIKISRHRDREKALKILYQIDVGNIEPAEGLDLFADNFQVKPGLSEFCRKLVFGVRTNQKKIDGLISQHASNWKLERISYIDRNILRIAIFEMIYIADIPPKVSINEAIEFSKVYGVAESSSFINGILDSVLAIL